MLLAPAIFRPLWKLYLDLPHDEEDGGAYLAERRAEIRLLVDTIWEQAVTNLFSEKPANHMEARMLIRRSKRRKAATEYAQVLSALAEVLRDYDALADPGYVSHEEPLFELVTGSLATLCETLAGLPEFRGDRYARLLLKAVGPQ